MTTPRQSAARRRSGGQGGARSSAASGSAAKSPVSPSHRDEAAESPRPDAGTDPPRDRGLRRAMFLVELAEARELRRRVAPRRARVAELHARLLRTFRY